VVVNILVTVPLIATVHSDTTAIDTFSPHVGDDNAFDARFNDGYGNLLYGIMLSEHLHRYADAAEYLEAFQRRYPLHRVGKYYYGWALGQVSDRVIDGLNILRELNEHLIEENKLFWEFNFRMGKMFMSGHNSYLASMSLERAAAERNTAEVAAMLGICYESIKAPDSMRAKYAQAIELGDSSKAYFYKIALASEQLGDSAKALEYYTYGVEHFPDYVLNYQYPARNFFLSQQYDSLEALAQYGLRHLTRSPELEACMILVYHYTDRPEQRDSAYTAFMDYFRTYPDALSKWGVFLEENGMVYEGRKMQAADVTTAWLNLKATLTFYHFYRGHGQPDSARMLIDRFIELDTTTAVLEVLEAVRRYDTVLWPPERAIDQ